MPGRRTKRREIQNETVTVTCYSVFESPKPNNNIKMYFVGHSVPMGGGIIELKIYNSVVNYDFECEKGCEKKSYVRPEKLRFLSIVG